MTQRWFTCLLTLILMPIGLAAQTPKADSLIEKLHVVESDSSRFRLLCRISAELRTKDPVKAYEYSSDALKVAEKLSDKKLQAEAHIDIGNCLDFQGKYLEEMEHFLKGLSLYEEINNEKGLSTAYNSMGILLYSMENYEKALEYYRKGYEIRKKGDLKGPISSSLNNLGIAHMDLGNLDSARYYFYAAIKINRETGNQLWESTNLHNLGQICFYEEKYDSAIILLEQALQIREKLDSRVVMATSHLALGQSRLLKGDYTGAEAEYKIAYLSGKELKSPRVIRKASRGLALAYCRLNEFQKATVLFEEYLEADDSLESSTLTSSITSGLLDKEKETQEKVLKAEAENQRLQQEAVLRQQQFYFTLAASGLLLMILVAILLFYLYRTRRKMTQMLEVKVEERTQKLVQANSELDKFIYQSSHDLRSPITSIRGLADIALSPAGQDDPARYLALIKDRAEHLDGVYSNLIHTMNIRDRVVKKEQLSLTKLFAEMEDESRKSRSGHNLRFEYQIEKDEIETDPLLIFQVFRSLAINATDFALPGRQPRCQIEAKREGEKLKITFTDNGTGIAEDALPKVFDMFFRGSNRSKGSGLGLYNARLAAEKIGAEIRVERTSAEGTAVSILV